MAVQKKTRYRVYQDFANLLSLAINPLLTLSFTIYEYKKPYKQAAQYNSRLVVDYYKYRRSLFYCFKEIINVYDRHPRILKQLLLRL
jgi:hypothetical protein